MSAELKAKEELIRQETLKIVSIAALIAIPLGVGGCIGIAYAARELSWSPALTGLLFGACLIGFIVLVAAIYIARLYLAPLREVQEIVKKMNTRDFTARVDTPFKQGMFKDLFDGINQLADSMRRMLREQAETADQLTAASEMMSSVSRETSVTAQETANTVSQLARGSEEQVHAIIQAQGTVNEIVEEIRKASERSQEANQFSLQAMETVEKGVDAVKKATRKMQQIKNTVDKSADAVRELGEHSAQIGLIVDVITSIADQTNLLALNAAIEAARAGEQGRGFAVVAGEVRTLAEGSAKAASQIANLVREIQSGIDQTIAGMEGGTLEAEEGNTVVAEAQHMLQEIDGASRSIAERVSAIYEATQQVAEKSGKVVEVMSSIAGISQESAASTQEVSASIEQQTAAMQEVTAAAQELDDIANRLREIQREFRV